jgi:hypothetical protein
MVMKEAGPSGENAKASEFERQRQRAAQGPTGPIVEFWFYLRHGQKWWTLPIIGALILAGALIVLGGTAAAPFIYALF